jgi:hypothetical protein
MPIKLGVLELSITQRQVQLSSALGHVWAVAKTTFQQSRRDGAPFQAHGVRSENGGVQYPSTLIKGHS